MLELTEGAQAAVEQGTTVLRGAGEFVQNGQQAVGRLLAGVVAAASVDAPGGDDRRSQAVDAAVHMLPAETAGAGEGPQRHVTATSAAEVRWRRLGESRAHAGATCPAAAAQAVNHSQMAARPSVGWSAGHATSTSGQGNPLRTTTRYH